MSRLVIPEEKITVEERVGYHEDWDKNKKHNCGTCDDSYSINDDMEMACFKLKIKVCEGSGICNYYREYM